jgi:hypothetical protein
MPAIIMTLLPILAQIAEGVIGKPDVNKWIDLAVQAAQGVTPALDAMDKLKAWAASGYTPTNAELDAVYADSQAIHDKIQGA